MADKKERESHIFEHVTIGYDDKTCIPFLYDFEKGYSRGSCATTEDGKVAVVFGVSNIKAEEPPTADYKRKEGEEVIPIFGIVFHSPENARTVAEYLHKVADYMEKREKEKP